MLCGYVKAHCVFKCFSEKREANVTMQFFCNNFIFPDEIFRYKTGSFSIIVKVNNRGGGGGEIYQSQTQI